MLIHHFIYDIQWWLGNTGGAQTDLASWGGFARPFSQRFGRDEMFGPGRNSRAQSSGGRSKKVVTINIE